MEACTCSARDATVYFLNHNEIILHVSVYVPLSATARRFAGASSSSTSRASGALFSTALVAWFTDESITMQAPQPPCWHDVLVPVLRGSNEASVRRQKPVGSGDA